MGAFCKSCGAPIVWVYTASGKAMPCEPDPVRFHPGDDEVFIVLPGGMIAHGTRADDGECEGFVSHFAACPYAGLHRKRKRPEP